MVSKAICRSLCLAFALHINSQIPTRVPLIRVYKQLSSPLFSSRHNYPSLFCSCKLSTTSRFHLHLLQCRLSQLLVLPSLLLSGSPPFLPNRYFLAFQMNLVITIPIKNLVITITMNSVMYLSCCYGIWILM